MQRQDKKKCDLKKRGDGLSEWDIKKINTLYNCKKNKYGYKYARVEDTIPKLKYPEYPKYLEYPNFKASKLLTIISLSLSFLMAYIIDICLFPIFSKIFVRNATEIPFLFCFSTVLFWTQYSLLSKADQKSQILTKKYKYWTKFLENILSWLF